MITINKTDDDAREFADGLDDHGDAELFLSLWESQRYIVLMGHFPHFGLVVSQDEAPAVEAPAVEAPAVN